MDNTDVAMACIDEEIFNFAYELALRDAVNQTAFNGIGKGSKTRLRGCVAAKHKVKNYICQIFAGNDPDFYDFAKPVEEAFACYNTEPEHGVFKFGNTQKLINMTAKYMFMATYNRPELRDNFKCCHCPMDSIMVEHAISKIDCGDITPDEINTALNEINDGAIEKRPGQKGWKGYLRTSWSTLELTDKDGFPGQYVMFQKIISILADKEKLSPIAYDFFVWGK